VALHGVTWSGRIRLSVCLLHDREYKMRFVLRMGEYFQSVPTWFTDVSADY
jgi:hypothetical protein